MPRGARRLQCDGRDAPKTAAHGPENNEINFMVHPAAAMNEPSASGESNIFVQASVVETVWLGEIHTYVVFCMFTCSHVEAGEELLWNYGEGCQSIRERAGYEAGHSCAEQLINGLRVPSPRGRVDAILRDGRRTIDVLYELALSGSDSSGEDWAPAERRRN